MLRTAFLSLALLAASPALAAAPGTSIMDVNGAYLGTDVNPLVTRPPAGGANATVNQGTANSGGASAWWVQWSGQSVAVSSLPPVVQGAAGTAPWLVAWSGQSVAVSALPSLPAGANVIGAVTQSGGPWSVSGTVSAAQSGAWTVGLGAGSAAIGTVGVTALPPLPAGSNAIGSVTVSNLPGTQQISAAALPLPAGAATAANQANTLIAPYGGAINIGTAQAVLAGCAVATSAQIVNNAQGSAIQCDTRESLKVVEAGSPDATVGIVPSVVPSGTTLVGKPSPGNLYGAYALNTTTTAGFLVVVNLASAPASGAAITPQECVPLPASGSATINYGAGPPDAYTTGIVVLVSTSCATYTPSTLSAFLRSRVR